MEVKPFLTPDGLVLPLNEATDPDITAPDSRVTWKEAMVAFAEEIGKLQETFTLGGSRVSILDDEFLKQEGPVPAFARILKREMSENPKLMKLIAPHMVQGELSAEGLEIMQNVEVPSDLDAMTKNRLTAQGATTEDRTKQRYFETANGGKVAVQGHKFGNKTVGTDLADKSLESQVGSPARHDELTTIVEERLAELDRATVDRERKDVGFLDGQDINKSLDWIKKWEGEIEAGEAKTKKGKMIKLGPALIRDKKAQIKRHQAKIESLKDASPPMQTERVNPMLQSKHAMLIEFLSDLVDPNIGPYPWEGDPAGKTISLDGVKHLREIAGLPGEKELLLKLRGKLDAVDYNVTSANLAELTGSPEEISGEALRSKGMVQEGGMDVSMDVEEAVGAVKQGASPAKAVHIKSKPFNRKLPALNLTFHKKQATANLMGGASKWDERKGDFNTALEQETFRLAFEADIQDVAWKLRKIREAVWLSVNLEPEVNAGRKSKVPFDESLTAMGGVLENVETFEDVEAVTKKLIAKAKLHRSWKVGDPDGIHDMLARHLDASRASDTQSIETLAQEGFGAFGSGKGRFWKTPNNTSGVIFEDPNQPTGNFYASRIKMRELVDAVKGLANMSGVVVMNIPFNIGAIPQIFKALVKLAIAFAADTGKSFADFAKAIRQKPDNEAVKVAWSDAKTGKIRSTESYTTRMLEDIVKIIQNRNADRAGYKQAVALDGYVNANWARFLDRFSLQQYKDSGIKAPIKALFNRYFINEYIDLADIMARVAKGGSGGKPLTASEVEDIIRKLPDSKNAWYLQDGLETLTSEKGLDMDKFQKEFFKQMLDNKVDPVKFTEYLVAKHAPERNAQIAAKNKKTGDFQDVENDPEGTTKGGGSGMGNRRARAIIAQARAEGKQALYEQLNDKYVRPVLRNTLDMARDSGLIDEANHTKLSSFYKHYVPLRGLEDSDDIMRTTGNGLDIRGREDVQKRAMGRKTEATEVIPYVFQQWSNMLVRSEKVKIMQAMAEFIEAHPNKEITLANPDYVRKLKHDKGLGEQVTWIRNPEWVNDTDLVGFKIAGKQHYMRFQNKELAHSMRNQGVAGLNSLLRTIGTGTRYLSRVNTQYNPGFTIPNFIRDIGLARMTLKSMDKADMAKELANIRNIPGQFHHKLFRKKKGAIYDALAAAFRADYLAKRDSKTLTKFFTSGDAKLDAEWDATYKEMKKHGGRIQFKGLLDMETRMDELSQLAKKIDKLSSRANSDSKGSMVKGWAVAVKELLEDVNTAVESSTRLAVYKLARDRGATPQQSAYLSRNSTINFTRRGKAGAGLNSLFMFYNASAQGASQIVGNINHTAKGKQIATQVIATGFAVEMFNQMFSGEDEDGVSIYEKIPEWKKNTNLIIVSPFGGKTFTFPLPYGYNALHYTGQKLFKVGKAAYLGTDGVPGTQATFPAAAELASTFASAFNPIGGSTSLARMMTPDLGDVIIDLNANKDWKGADIYPEPSPFAPYAGPDSSRHWSTVNPGLKYIAQKVNEITGGDAVSSGWVDVSPETLEHVFGHVFGGAGSTAIRTEGVFHGMYNKEVPAANDIPIMRRFIAAPSSFYALEKFKNLRALSEQAADMYKLYVENGEHADAKEYRKVNDVMFKIHPYVKNAGSQIRKINKHMRIAGASKGLTPADRAIRLRRLKLQKNKVMNDTNSRFVDLLLPMK